MKYLFLISILLLSGCTQYRYDAKENPYPSMPYDLLERNCYQKMQSDFSDNEVGKCMRELINSGTYTRTEIK